MQSVDVIEELLKHGANTNLKFGAFPIRKAFETLVKTNDIKCFDIMKLLFEFGANINDDPISSLGQFLWIIMKLKKDIFTPAIQLVLQHANNETKTFALYNVFSPEVMCHPLCYGENEVHHRHELENSVRAAKILLESGAHPGLDMLSSLLRSGKVNRAMRFPVRDFDLVMDLFKLIIPYIFIMNISKERELMAYDVADDFRNLGWSNRNKFISIVIANMFLHELRKLWNECLNQWLKLRCDILADNCSVLKTTADLCGTDTTPVTSNAVYGLLLKFVRKEYPYFANVMRHAVKNSDMVDLSSLIWKQKADNGNIITPDSFYHVTHYLTKDEVLNYLLALLPNKI